MGGCCSQCTNVDQTPSAQPEQPRATDPPTAQVEEPKPEKTATKPTGQSVSGTESVAQNSYLTEEEEDTIKGWLSQIDTVAPVPLGDDIADRPAEPLKNKEGSQDTTKVESAD